jgi:hypothetical protein
MKEVIMAKVPANPYIRKSRNPAANDCDIQILLAIVDH